MCSIGDEIEDDENVNKFMQETPKINIIGNKCNKCREATPCIVLRQKDTYCKNCFITGTVHKFKSLLGKHRLIKDNENVLVYYKLGHPSAALMHFLRAGLNLQTPKRLRFKPIFIYVEDQFEYLVSERREVLKKIYLEISSQGFNVYFVSLLDYILNQNNIKVTQSFEEVILNESDKHTLKSIIDKKANMTVYEDILHTFRKRLLIDVAKKLNCNSIFTPEISSDTASNLLSNIAQGRGFQLPLNVGLCDSSDPDVKLIRPLRVFEMKELAYYNTLNNVEPVTLPYKNKNPYDSIQNLMEKFITELQVNYPSTVTTVLRTGDKLAMGNTSRETQTCDLCKGPIEITTEELSASESTNFSHWISTQGNENGLQGDECQKANSEFDNINSNMYCYGCRRTINYLHLHE